MHRVWPVFGVSQSLRASPVLRRSPFIQSEGATSEDGTRGAFERLESLPISSRWCSQLVDLASACLKGWLCRSGKECQSEEAPSRGYGVGDNTAQSKSSDLGRVEPRQLHNVNLDLTT